MIVIHVYKNTCNIKKKNKKQFNVSGFKRKEFRGKLAIAITANFINGNTQAEASVEEISGVAFIFNQKFFLDLREQTGIDLENIVYYKDETHYFVMTAKKNSLLEKGVLLNVRLNQSYYFLIFVWLAEHLFLLAGRSKLQCMYM